MPSHLQRAALPLDKGQSQKQSTSAHSKDKTTKESPCISRTEAKANISCRNVYMIVIIFRGLRVGGQVCLAFAYFCSLAMMTKGASRTCHKRSRSRPRCKYKRQSTCAGSGAKIFWGAGSVLPRSPGRIAGHGQVVDVLTGQGSHLACNKLGRSSVMHFGMFARLRVFSSYQCTWSSLSGGTWLCA